MTIHKEPSRFTDYYQVFFIVHFFVTERQHFIMSEQKKTYDILLIPCIPFHLFKQNVLTIICFKN